MIDNLIKSILEQIGVLVERQAPEELIKTLPNGQWELLRKAAPKVPDSPHTQSNAMTSRLFHHANAVHEALQPHFDKHMAEFRQAPMTPSSWNSNYNIKEASLMHLQDHPVDVPVHPALQVWGDQVEEKTGKRPDFNTNKSVRGALKQHLLDLPRGQIDLGHLNKLREGSKKIPERISDHSAWRDGDEPIADPYTEVTEHTSANRILSTNDMEEIINHHVGNAKSLKEIHDNNGGIDAIEAMGRTMGANTSPIAYSKLKLHPQVHADLMNLMRPGSHQYEWPTDEFEAHGQAFRAAYNDAVKENPEGTRTDFIEIAHQHVPPFEGIETARQLPDSTYGDEWDDTKHREAVDSTYFDMAGGDESQVGMKNHENAVINRALDRFKSHHKL